MKHASETTINLLEPFLEEIRFLQGLKEKKPGIFYRKSRAFLHFHEDGDNIYADVRLKESEFEHFSATTEKEQATLLRAIKKPYNEFCNRQNVLRNIVWNIFHRQPKNLPIS